MQPYHRLDEIFPKELFHVGYDSRRTGTLQTPELQDIFDLGEHRLSIELPISQHPFSPSRHFKLLTHCSRLHIYPRLLQLAQILFLQARVHNQNYLAF
jgi:hypothetical protein